MENKTNELHSEMKKAISMKTKCMIESYGEVLESTKSMIESKVGKMVTDDEILKRADMFWNIALQKIDQDKNQMNRGPNGGPRPQNMPSNQPMPSSESPCAKKQREAAAKIATLEAEVIENKEKKAKDSE